MIGKKAADKFARWRWYEFAAGRAGFFGLDAAFNISINTLQYDNVARLAFGFAAFSVTACLDCIHDRGVGTWATDAELFKFLNERAFSVARRRTGKDLARLHGILAHKIAGGKCR